MAHIDTESLPSSGTGKPKKLCSRYKGGALARTPGVDNSDKSPNPKIYTRGKKQMITRYSQSSRNTFKNKLATVRTDAVLYTLALTLPGYVEHFDHVSVKRAFTRVMKRLTAKCARDPDFRRIAGFYKQELQGRMCLHFHLLLSGLVDSNIDEFWGWFVDQWIECVMAIPGMPPEIVAEETRKMRAVHMHQDPASKFGRKSNLQRIVGDFHSYFAKYLGKDDDAHVSENPIPGRWWGSFNKEHIPFGELQELEMPERVCVHSHRVARRIRQERANNARYRALCRKYDMLKADGSPCVSRVALLRCYTRLRSVGGVGALQAWDDGQCPAVRKLVVNGDTAPLIFLLKVIAAGDRAESVLGRFRFPSSMKYSAVTLTGRHVPDMMHRIWTYAANRALIDRERTPF